MKNFRSILAATALVLSAASLPARAADMMTADHAVRVSHLLHASVYNDQNQKIGEIDDVLLPATGGEASAVLSVGQFTGGSKMVKVPLSHVHLDAAHMTMPGKDGMKPALVAMPAYTYDLMGGGG
jgi:sporulation protein YlmC with PRC-barrel domain